jgi:hypothetical protein
MFPTLCSMTSFMNSWTWSREASGGLVDALVLVFAKLDRVRDCLTLLLFRILVALELHMQSMSNDRMQGILAVE